MAADISMSRRSTLLLVLAALIFMIPTSTDGREVYCGNTPADVVFLLDSSNSVWARDFRRMLSFVANVTRMFQIGENHTQIGLAIFNDRFKLEFNLNDYHDQDSLLNAIYNVRQIYGTHTATHEALRFMRRRMFHKGNGMREGVVRIAVVFTDGMSENRLKTLVEASRAKRNGINIIAVGIGGAVNKRELHGVASSPARENSFSVVDFNVLDSIKNKLAVKTCTLTTPKPKTTTTTPTTTTTTTTRTPTTTTTTTPTTTTTTTPTTTTHLPTSTNATTTTTTTTTSTTSTSTGPTTTNWVDVVRQFCHKKLLDVVFALDSSDVITRQDFWYQIKFVRDFTVGLDIGMNKSRIGLVMYSDYVVHGFDVTDHVSLSSAIGDLYRMERIYGGTGLDEVIRYVRTKSYRRSVARKHTAQLLVLLTGSSSPNLHRVRKQSNLARKTGVNIITVAFGKDVNIEELSIISGNQKPTPKNSIDSLLPLMEDDVTPRKKLFVVESSADLQDVVMDATIEACSAEVVVTPVFDQVCGTRQEADMMFVIDSTSAGRKNTKKTMDFMQSVTQDMKVDRDSVQVGMIIPDKCLPYTHSFTLERHDKKGVTNALDGRIDDDFAQMLKGMRKDAFKRRQGGRRDAKKIAVIIVDGSLDKPLKVLKEVRRAQIKGIEIYVIVVGQERPQPELRDMCNYPPQQHFFQVPEYDRLKEIEDSFIEILCDEL